MVLESNPHNIMWQLHIWLDYKIYKTLKMGLRGFCVYLGIRVIF